MAKYKQSDYTVYVQCLHCNFIAQIFMHLKHGSQHQVLISVPQNETILCWCSKAVTVISCTAVQTEPHTTRSPSYKHRHILHRQLQVTRMQHKHNKWFWVKLFFYLSWKSFCSIEVQQLCLHTGLRHIFTLYCLGSEFGCQVKLDMNRLYYMQNQDLAVLINSLLNLQLQNMILCTWD